MSDNDHVTIPNTINDQFVKASFDIPPLDLGVPEAYSPSKEPHHHWDVYTELRKVKSAKATVPEEISPKLVTEFAYELSSPVTDILNCLYKERVVAEH